MRTSGTAEAYARALYELAVVSDAVGPVDEGLGIIVETVRGSVELRDALADDAVPAEKKRAALWDLFAGTVAPEAVAVAGAVVERGHVDLLGDVSRTFREVAEKESGVVVADVTTAVPLTDSLRESIVGKLSSSLGRPVALRERVDEAIVGGVIIKIAGRVLDGSVSSQLDQMRVALTRTSQGGEA